MKAKYDRLNNLGGKKNPKENAGLFSTLTFSWVKEILAIANNRPLENEDLYSLLDEDKTKTSTEKLRWIWNEEVRRHRLNGSRHRLLRALVTMVPLRDFMFLLSITLLATVGSVLQPVLLSFLFPELIKPSPSHSRWAYVYAAAICLSSVVYVVSRNHLMYHSSLTALRWKSATVGLLFKKVNTKDLRKLIIILEVWNFPLSDTGLVEIAVDEKSFHKKPKINPLFES